MNLSKNPGLHFHQVINRPLITEKTTHMSNRLNCYSFLVNLAATKTDVKQAVEEYFRVRVLAVRIQNRIGKPRRHKSIVSSVGATRRAFVTLHADDRISLF
jgi:large subunit ribosomal protein L23